MKIFVKTLGGTKLEIEVNPEDKVADLKKTLESVHGAAVYPAAQQILVHQGIFLEDDTTLEENEIVENSSIAIMLSRSKVSSTGESSASAAPSSQPASTSLPVSSQPAAAYEGSIPFVSVVKSTPSTAVTPASHLPRGNAAEADVSQLVRAVSKAGLRKNPAAQAQQPVEGARTGPRGIPAQADVSQVVQILSRDRKETNPAAQAQQPVEGAPTGSPNTKPLDLFPQDIPAQTVSQVVQAPCSVRQATNPAAQAQQPVEGTPTGGRNAVPLDLFPRDLRANRSASVARHSLDFLYTLPQFRRMRAMVRSHPEILTHMLRELGTQNPRLLRRILLNQADFLRFLNASNLEHRYILGLSPSGRPHYVTVTPEEQQAIYRLEAMGFNRTIVWEGFFACNNASKTMVSVGKRVLLEAMGFERTEVLEAFFSCNRNENLAANFLLDR